MDGTLLESEKLTRACFIEACADLGWVDLDMSVYDRVVGGTYEATGRILRAGYGPAFPLDAVQERWSEIYHAHIDARPVDLKPGVETLLLKLQDLDVPMALATSSHRGTTEKKLSMAGLIGYFDFLVCGGETSQGKPHPAPYLHATSRLGQSAGVCWAVEDSDNGVRSAVAAGLKVIQIPDEMTPSDEVRALGHEIVETAEVLIRWLD